MPLYRVDILGLDRERLELPTGSKIARMGNLTIDQVCSMFGYRYYEGNNGLGLYTVQPDEGWYYVFYARQSGTGLRSGTWRGEHTIVSRFTTKRKSKKSAMDRAYTLAHGRSRSLLVERSAKKENHPHTGFCLKEKKHVLVSHWSESQTQTGRWMLRGQCPDCGTEVSKLGKLIDCPGCDNWEPEKKGDYLCRVCRWTDE